MKKIFAVFMLVCTAAIAGGNRETALAATTPCAFTNLAGEVLLYREARPAGQSGPVPLVVFLHGAGERGNDNTAQLVHCVGPILDYFKRRNKSVHLIAPQCEKDRRWVEVDWSAAAHRMPLEPSKMMRLVLQLVEKTVREPSINPARVYVCGISMGGYGTWDIASRRPDLFAAAMPVCGGGDAQQAWRLRELPVLAVHGDGDAAVPTARSRDMVDALRRLNAPIRYVECPNCNHNCWTPAFNDDSLLDWFFSHRNSNSPLHAAYLKPRLGEPNIWEIDPCGLSPAAYLERLRHTGSALRLSNPAARVICRRDLVNADFTKALDAFGEGEEYEYRDGPSTAPVLVGHLPSPLLCAGYGRAYLLGTDGSELASWNGCGNIHRVFKTSEYLWWSNGRVWRVPLAGGKPELVWKAENEIGGGVLGFTVASDGSVVMAVNSSREIVELAPPRAFPPHSPFQVRTRFKVDARLDDGSEPGAHGALRMIRKTPSGTYLVCCSSAAKVKEFDHTGKLLWEVSAPPFAFDCLRRANGNTLISHLNGVSEFTPTGKVVWKISCADFPELKLNYLCGIQELTNGNLVIGTWSNGGTKRENTTAFEITRDKELVWAHRSADANMMTAFRVD